MNNKIIPFISELEISEQQKWIAEIQSASSELEIILFEQLSKEDCQQVEVAIVAAADTAKLSALPQLKWVQSLWAGVEKLLQDNPHPCFQIVTMEDPELAVAMSQSVLAWTLFLHHQIPAYRLQQQQQNWHQLSSKLYSETTIGILGLGNLGKVSATKLVEQGFSVSGWSRGAKNIDGVNCYSGETGLDLMLQSSDILISQLPLTRETHHLIDSEKLALLPQGSAVINFSRGSVIDYQALVNSLDTKHLSHGVLDVFEEEPLPRDNPLWRHPKLTILPHISAPTNKKSASKIVVSNIMNFIINGVIPNSVDVKSGY